MTLAALGYADMAALSMDPHGYGCTCLLRYMTMIVLDYAAMAALTMAAFGYGCT